LLSREFNVENCLLVWDYIFAGCLNGFEGGMENIEFFCVAMISSKRLDLLESEFTMCLGILMSYKECM
jgi:hypothetical protein